MAVAKGRTERDVAYGPGGLKAEAGLRGPYGTSVRHIWPTWTLLVPAVTLISTSLSLFLFLSLFTSIFLRKLSFLDLTKYRSSVMHSVLFSFQRYLVFWFILSLSTSVVTCPVENPRFSFFLSYVHTLLAIIKVFSVMMSINVMARLSVRLASVLLFWRGRESAFQFYYPPWHDLDNEILRGVFWPPSELHSTIIEIRMKRILSERALQSRGPVDDRGRTWAKPPGAEGVGFW